MARTHGSAWFAAALMLTALGMACTAAASDQTWDLAADSLAAAGPVIPITHGQWSHGYAANMGEFTLCDMAYYGSSNDGLARWVWSATNDGGAFNGCPMQLVNTNATGPTYGLFYPGKYYCHGGNGTDQHPFYNVMRWTAPAAGLYSVSAVLHAASDTNPAGVSCGIFVDGVNVLSGAFSASDPPLVLTGAFEVAGTIDLDLGPGASTGAQWTQVDLTIATMTSGTISGTVKAADLPGQAGFPGATVRTADGRFSTVTDLQGDYLLLVAEGTYLLQASKPGYLTATSEVSVADGQTVEVDFELVRAPVTPPVVNEIQSANSMTIEDEDGDHPDWIEIANTGGWVAELAGYGLSDDASTPFKWTFPSYSLQPGQFLVVFASDKDRKTGTYFHTNFAIKSGGETISLTAPDGTLVSRIPATSIAQDLSYGRQPDGSDSLYFFPTPTPGQPNTTPGYTGILTSPPAFSRARGFFDLAFNLTLSTSEPNSTIRYTTDGSTPTESSTAYTAPIAIPSGASGEIFRTTCVRARLFRTGYMPSPVATNTYFVGPSAASRYNLPIVSLVTDYSNFYDSATGIYVNYEREGEAWERPIHIEFFEPGGTDGFHCDGGVRIHGGWTTRFPQKSLRLYADHQGGPGSFDYQIFPDSPLTDYKRVVLRNWGDDNEYLASYWFGTPRPYTLIRDPLSHLLIKDLDIDVQNYRPAIVFFDGSYWGIYGLIEREDKYWLKQHHPEIDEDNLDLIQQNPAFNDLYPPSGFEIGEGDIVNLKSLFDWFPSHDLILPANYDYIKARMDISNYLIHSLSRIYCGDSDWPGNNIRYWRERNEASRWRWGLTDTDFGWALVVPHSGSLLGFATARGGTWSNPDPACLILASMLRAPESRAGFINRMADMLNTVYEPGAVVAKIDSMTGELSPYLAEHFSRWGDVGNVATWSTNVQGLRTYANQRPGYVRDQFVRFFRLSGTSNLIVNATGSGSVALSTVSIASGSFPWQGVYFNDTPINLTAVPAAGQRFVRWTGAGLGTQNPATIILQGDTTVTAVFEVNQ